MGCDRVSLKAGTEKELFLPKNRRHSDEWGTAVNVQAMVFGNMGDNSAPAAFTAIRPPVRTNLRRMACLMRRAKMLSRESVRPIR